jgi:hypothetical protein
MIDRPGVNRQPDLLVRATNTLDLNRIPAQIRAEVASLLKLLIAQHIAADVAPPREAADE